MKTPTPLFPLELNFLAYYCIDMRHSFQMCTGYILDYIYLFIT